MELQKNLMKIIHTGIILTSSIFLFSIADLSFAGVAGSRHDMYFLSKGTDPNPCAYCHIPHNAAGDKIWSDWANEAQLTSGPSTTIGNMCYTCHDGTASYRGLNSVFNLSLQQHKISAGRDCDMCHSVHDNTNGQFMNIAGKQNSYCAACHDAAVNAGGLGDHVSYPANHPNCGGCHGVFELDSLGANGDDASCHLCHAKAHGAVNYTAGSITNPILKSNNTDSQYCGLCHPDLVQANSGGSKHPANTSGSAYGKITCQSCHDPHQPGITNQLYLLTDSNIDSQMCIDCHNGSSGPDIGHSHPNQVSFGTIVPVDASPQTGTPPGNQINDNDYDDGHSDPDTYPDYPANSASMICETCHSVHRKADNAGIKLLRITNTNSALCLNCHTDK